MRGLRHASWVWPLPEGGASREGRQVRRAGGVRASAPAPAPARQGGDVEAVGSLPLPRPAGPGRAGSYLGVQTASLCNGNNGCLLPAEGAASPIRLIPGVPRPPGFRRWRCPGLPGPRLPPLGRSAQQAACRLVGRPGDTRR